MKKKLISFVVVLTLILSLFVVVSSAESSPVASSSSSNTRATPPHSYGFFMGLASPDLQGAIDAYKAYFPELTNNEINMVFRFAVAGIEFSFMSISTDGIWISGNNIGVQIYSSSSGWVSYEFMSMYVINYAPGGYDNNFRLGVYSALIELFAEVDYSDYLRIPQLGIESEFSVQFGEGDSFGSFVGIIQNLFGLPNPDLDTQYGFEAHGVFQPNGYDSFTFDMIYFEGNMEYFGVRLFNDSTGESYGSLYGSGYDNSDWDGAYLIFDSCPLLLKNYLVLFSEYKLLSYPYFVHNDADLSFIDISMLTDATYLVPFNLSYSYASFSSYDGYPLNFYTSMGIGGGTLASSYPQLPDGTLCTPDGVPLNDCILVPNGSIASYTPSDSQHYIFMRQVTSNYNDGLEVTNSMDFVLRNQSFDTSMFNRATLLRDTWVKCGALVDGNTYYWVRRVGQTLQFSADDNLNTYDTYTLDNMRNFNVTLIAGSVVSPVFYSFVTKNGILVVNGGIDGDYADGYDKGYHDGYDYGYRLGDNEGYNRGYNEGYATAKDIFDVDSGGIIHRLLSAPGEAFDGLILYEDDAIVISLWDVFTTLLTASLFVWFLKMFAGG